MAKRRNVIKEILRATRYLRRPKGELPPRIVVITTSIREAEIISFLLTGEEESEFVRPIIFSELEINPRGSGRAIKESDATIVFSKNPLVEAEAVAATCYFVSHLTPAWCCFLTGSKSLNVASIISEVIGRNGGRIFIAGDSEELSHTIIQAVSEILLDTNPGAISEIVFSRPYIAKNLYWIEGRIIARTLLWYLIFKEMALPLVVKDFIAASSILKETTFKQNEQLAKLTVALPILSGVLFQNRGNLASRFLKGVILPPAVMVLILILITKSKVSSNDIYF